ncbi:MAG: inner-rane translocator [Blastococcus sp.]|jgi:branched-chain amino acid transport system permease protein|nr:inner-rane translocator [Blastococcus sp.]
MTGTRVRTALTMLLPLLGIVLLGVFGTGADDYTIYVLTLAVLAAISAMGLDVLMGYAGYVSLAQGAMYGIGAYTTAILTREHAWSFWAALGGAVVVAAAIAAVLAGLLFRTRGLYFAIVTLGIGLIASGLFVSAREITGGPSGYVGIPGITPFLGWQPTTDAHKLVIALVLLAVLYLVAALFVQSTWGRRSVAIREDEVLARSLGIRPEMPRFMAFVFAAVCAAVAGSFFAAYSNFISPTSFGLLAVGFQAVVIVVVGGMGTLWGPMLAALLLTALPEGLRVADQLSALLYGVVLLIFILFAPRGLAGLLTDAVRAARRAGGRRVGTVLVKEGT